jgi:hypothetical protein
MPDNDTTRTIPKAEPPLFAPDFPLLHKFGIVARHMVPAIGVLEFGAPVGQFALLTQFNIALSIGCITVFDADIARRKELSSMNRREQLADFAQPLRRCLLFALPIAALFSIPAILAYGLAVFTLPLFASATMMIVAAVPGLFEKYRADIRTEIGVAKREHEYIPQNQSLLICAILLAFYLPYGDPDGDSFVVMATTVLLIFRELRPDLLMRLLKIRLQSERRS